MQVPETRNLSDCASRLLDIVVSVAGLVILGPLMLLIAAAVLLDGGGPVFFAQTRLGQRGRHFRMYKFRKFHARAGSSGPLLTRANDPRMSRLGRLLAATKLDELPQLWNILRGDMSLIGPRPERPEHVQRLQQSIPFYRTRLIVRPGLTGWAQVMYGYGSTDDDALVKLQYDLFYIRHRSLLLDANILVKTVGRVLRMSGV
jgi:lipopolysaccharide/colanic/teichoic acid biosynthesis glycosyltransferase